MNLTKNHTDLPFKIVILKPDAAEDANSLAHRHDYFELFIFETEGKGHFIDFKNYEVNPSSMHLVIPGSIHLLKRNSKTNGFVLLFSDEFYHQNNPKDNLWLEIIPHILKSGASLNIDVDKFKLIKELCTHITMTNDNEIQRSYLQLIIMHLKSIFNLDTTIASSSKSKLAYDFRKELELNFYENHKVGFYAEKLNISVSSLNKKVEEVFNMSPSEMVLERLLLEAKRLLYYNEYSSKEIAYKLGYNDDSYFSRIFKQKIGLSPNQFRKDSRQEFK